MLFTELPFDQQQTLYIHAAHDVLALHDIMPDVLEPLTLFNNAVFHVAAGSRQWALRIYRPRQSSGRAIQSELAWLTAINNETALRVPQPQSAPNGEMLIRTRNHTDDALYGVLFDWIDGTTIEPNQHTPELAHHIGMTIAQLHEHSRHFSQMGEHPRRKLTADQFVFWQLIEAFTPRLFTPEHHAVFRALETRIRAVFARFQASDYGLLHGDLMPKNIIVNHAGVSLLDFESCGWGFYPYDLAPLLLSYLNEPQYPVLRHALLDGYRTMQQLDLNDSEIDVLIAARHGLSCAWLARHLDHPEIGATAPATINQRMHEIAQLLGN